MLSWVQVLKRPLPKNVHIKQKTLWGIEGIPPLEIRGSYHLGYEKIFGAGGGQIKRMLKLKNQKVL